MKCSYHPHAEAELFEAMEYYDRQQPGLGLDFWMEIQSALQLVQECPEGWRELEGGVRKAPVRRFPYGLLYAMEHDTIQVLAVMHLHRAPGYWQNRLQ